MAPNINDKPEAQEVDVTASDQKTICRFSCLVQRLQELEADFQLKKEEVQGLKDAEEEVLIRTMEGLPEQPETDDAAPASIAFVRYGEAFFDFGEDETMESIQQRQEKSEKEFQKMKAELETVVDQMATLKRQLYDKFGNQIQLDM
eukprot:GHVS01000586.1.p1 GENE.GHVS01000586.1~~GHVS01000586.1.p1  ORF type:complete len:146 (+),score=31.18 GHVS01000586.1:703-1140(+)